MFKRLTVALIAVAVVAVAGTAVAQTMQRFNDVPPDHEAFEAIEWAASAGVTAGYDDGTFKPDRPLSKRHAVVFMERFYDDILGAEQSEDFTRSDMMVLLKAINDGTPPEPESASEATTGRWLPRPDDRTADGRCTHRVNDTDFYEWEDCAWGAVADPVMGRAAMQALAERVWSETKARGKPDRPPTLTEGRCREARAAARYFPGSHTISIESGVTLRALLHELAHALVSGDDVLADCYADWTSIVPHCAHGPLFRCAADALYVRYADLDPAGVCGAVPDTGDWTRHSAVTIDGTYHEWRNTFAARNKQTVMLALRCDSDGLTVYANGTWSYFAPAWRGGGGEIEYRFGDQPDPSRILAIEQDNLNGYGDWWVVPSAEAARFLGEMAADTSGRLFMRLIAVSPAYGDDPPSAEIEAETTLRTTGYRTHVQPFVQACN